MTYHLGVDIGTTYTAAARSRDGRAEPIGLGGRSLAIPSVVYMSGDELLVGDAAERRAVTEPGRVAREFKRRVGDPTPILVGGSPVSAELLMARLLEHVVQQVGSLEGAPPTSIAVTHPANWGAYKLDLLREAIRHVGLRVDHLVPEPVAAASFYAAERSLQPGTLVAVYDLGGGTFDAAVVRAQRDSNFEIVGRPDGVERLGGIDFDHAVFSHVVMALGLDLDQLDHGDPSVTGAVAQLRHDCVVAKEALSTETDVSIPVLLPNLHTEVRLTRHELESMIRPALGETLVALRRAVESAHVPIELVSSVLLVGGSSRIPLVAQLVAAELGRPVAMDARPKEAISLGAALAAESAAPTNLRDERPEPVTAPRKFEQEPSPSPSPVPIAAAPSQPPRRRNALVTAAAVVLLILGLGTAALASGLRDNDETATGDGSTTTTTSEGSDSTTTSGLNLGDLGDITLGDLGYDSGEPANDPLPGKEWSDETRAAFLPECEDDGWDTLVPGLDIDASAVCACIYDRVSSSDEFTFQEFNDDVWTAEEASTDTPAGEGMSDAVNDCLAEQLGLSS